jgi:hypothetical protein
VVEKARNGTWERTEGAMGALYARELWAPRMWDLQRDLMLVLVERADEAGVAGEGRNICSSARARETPLAGRACPFGLVQLEL